ncbi:MAG: hypothetical protein ACRC41_18490 [Sarcina sp.]
MKYYSHSLVELIRNPTHENKMFFSKRRDGLLTLILKIIDKIKRLTIQIESIPIQ